VCSGIERTGTLVPVHGAIVPFGGLAGAVPAVPAVRMTCGLVSKKGRMETRYAFTDFFIRFSLAEAWEEDDAVIDIRILGIDEHNDWDGILYSLLTMCA
jgi:hypothetical protein